MSSQGSAPQKSLHIAFIVLVFLITIVKCAKYSSKYKDIELVNQIESKQHDFSDKITFFNAHLNGDKDDVSFTTKDNVSGSIESVWPMKILNCIDVSGLEKCLKIFLLKRMDHVMDVIKAAKNDDQSNVSVEFDVVSEIEKNFDWENYKQIKDNELNEKVFKDLKTLFKNKKTKLLLHPGIMVDVSTNANESMMLNIKKDPQMELPRGMKFPKKAFYRLVPILLIPPLIMSAILPFVLPAMKIMILGVGLMNQVALMGSVFTLMRNNAFQDTYHKKIIYVNDGYKNEHKAPPIVHHQRFHHAPIHQQKPIYHEEPHHDSYGPHHDSYQGQLIFPAHDDGYDEEGGDFSHRGSFHDASPPNFHNFDEDEYDRSGHRSKTKYGSGMKKKSAAYPGK